MPDTQSVLSGRDELGVMGAAASRIPFFLRRWEVPDARRGDDRASARGDFAPANGLSRIPLQPFSKVQRES